MKKILVLSFAALFFAATTHAQSADTTAHHSKMGKGMMMQKNEEKMAKELNLTSDQKTQFQTIDQAQKSTMDSIKTSSASKEDKRKAMMDAMKNNDDQKRAILNPEQQTKFDKMMAKRQEMMKRWKKGPSNQPSGGSQ